MKKYIFIVCLFLALNFVAYPAYASSAKKPPSDHGGGEGEEEAVEDDGYFNLKPLFVPIVTDEGVMQHVSLLISLEIEEGVAKEIEHYRPRLVSAYIEDLYGAFSSGEAMLYDDLVDVETIRIRLLEVTTKTLGDNFHVKDVLLKVVQQSGL